jgi:polyhydroxyalkanoate synthesis repressor PhaR
MTRRARNGARPEHARLPGGWLVRCRTPCYFCRMASPRVIKKYPNRRLYDTKVSSYITLEEVRQLVMAGEHFEVRDAKTNEDLTRAVLLQIIAEHEQHGQPIFSTTLLSQIIRFYGDAMQGFVGNYLENSLKVFLDQQHKFRDQLNSLLGQTPWSMLNEATERNIELWKSLQPAAPAAGKPAAEPPSDDRKPARKRR